MAELQHKNLLNVSKHPDNQIEEVVFTIDCCFLLYITLLINVQPRKDLLKDLPTLLMEERFKAEERKEILGEEWRKIAKIFDR